ncbi:MAG: transcription termination/antitermination NusG family protein [Thermodesulfobacteriota bacterium]
MTLKKSDNPPSRFPEDLFFNKEKKKNNERVWWVARTKSRQEKALAWNLLSRGVEYFLPLVTRPQKQKGRMRTSIAPLFNGYLFFKGTNMERYEAVSTGRIAQVMEVADQAGLYRELKSLAQVTEQRMHLELCDFVNTGQRVQIIQGPLEGIEGVVQKQKNKTRLILKVESICQAAAVEVDLDQIRALD